MSFLGKLWRGEYPLVKSFWLFFIVGDLFYHFLFGLFGGFFSGFLGVHAARRSGSVAIFLMLVYFAYVVYLVISSVGTWRSSDNYSGSKVWGILAKIYIVLCWSSIAHQLIQ